MSLSIIVPCFNEAASIGSLLDDLQPSRASGAELIVVDGGSTDGTIDIAAPNVDVLIPSPPGRAVQSNQGAAGAGGDILWFVHADSRVPAEAPGAIIQACTDAGAWGRFDIRLSGQAWYFRLIEWLINRRSRLSGIATGDQGLFIHRSLFEAVGGFPEIALMEDIAISKMLRERSKPICLDKPHLETSSRRWEQRGVVRTILLMWRLRAAYALGASPEQLARQYR